MPAAFLTDTIFPVLAGPARSIVLEMAFAATSRVPPETAPNTCFTDRNTLITISLHSALISR